MREESPPTGHGVCGSFAARVMPECEHQHPPFPTAAFVPDERHGEQLGRAMKRLHEEEVMRKTTSESLKAAYC